MGGNKPQPPQQPQYYQPQQQTHYQPQTQYRIPNPNELRRYDNTETSDGGPSRINGPNVSDNLDIENILKTMNDRKKEKLERTDTSDDIMKNIPIGNKKTKRGRPKKNNQNINLAL
jgi:hypothetical protein